MRPDLQLFRILDPVLTMAAALTVQSPFVTRGNFDSTVRVASATPCFLVFFFFFFFFFLPFLTFVPHRRATSSIHRTVMPSRC